MFWILGQYGHWSPCTSWLCLWQTSGFVVQDSVATVLLANAICSAAYPVLCLLQEIFSHNLGTEPNPFLGLNGSYFYICRCFSSQYLLCLETIPCVCVLPEGCFDSNCKSVFFCLLAGLTQLHPWISCGPVFISLGSGREGTKELLR